MPVIPQRLQHGDTVGLVAPASAPVAHDAIDRSTQAIEELGFKPKLARNIHSRHGFLAGDDRERTADLMAMFRDRTVKAILCVRGGYGTARLLNRLDYDVVRSHPKIFVGYSDVTSLHCAFLAKASLVTYHGPMAASDFIKPEFPRFTLQSFLRTLTVAAAPGGIRQGYRRKTVTIIRRGLANGPLIGGNLSILCTTLGTPIQPSFQNSILFLEEIDEPPYRIDRMLTHLLNAGVLQQVAGVAVGLCAQCEDPKAKTTREYRQSLLDVLKDRLGPLKVPVVAGLPFGHVPHNATLPIGLPATLDARHGDLILPVQTVG